MHLKKPHGNDQFTEGYVRTDSFDAASFERACKSFQQLFSEANAFILQDDSVLDDSKFVAQIHARIQAGARLLIQIGEAFLDRQNAFLSKYDLTGTKIRIQNNAGPAGLIKRSADSFRDSRLFAGVDEVQIQCPNAVWYGGESLPVLIADDQFTVVDGESDFPADWNGRDLACAASWHGKNQGGVLAMSGVYFRDPFEDLSGYRWPCIEANLALARNVIKYLAEGSPTGDLEGLLSADRD